MSSRVYDDRTNETLFKGDTFDCTMFILDHFDEDSEDFPHVWIESFEMLTRNTSI